MRKDLDEKLTNDFPNLYRDRNDKACRSGIRWGYTCGNGWYPLIYRTSAKLEKLILQLPENKMKFYKATQVKQKFGGLRLYMYDRTQEMKDIISEAEEKSFHVCESCGKPGELIQIPHRWVTTSCKDHLELTHWQDMDKVKINWLVNFKHYIGA
jgi:hypothetical protein